MGNTNLSDEQRQFLQPRARGPWIVSSITLIAVGVLLFLGNLGILPITDVWVFWPAIPIAFGLGRLFTARQGSQRASGIFLILFGALFLLGNLGWIHLRVHDGSWIISLVLISIGFTALSSISRSARIPGRVPPGFNWPSPRRAPGPFNAPDIASYETTLNDFVLFGGLKRKLESVDFRGGQLTTIFGNVEVDLRRAHVTPEVRSVVINVLTLFGSTKLRVPEYWRVIVSGSGILGSYEDKTIPPAIGPEPPR